MSDRPPSNFYKDPPRKWPEPKKAVVSDRVDTEAVRADPRAATERAHEALMEHRFNAKGTRCACGETFSGDPDELTWHLAAIAARAALAESGDTERPATMDTGLVEVRQVWCPTCKGKRDEPLVVDDGQDSHAESVVPRSPIRHGTHDPISWETPADLEREVGAWASLRERVGDLRRLPSRRCGTGPWWRER